MSRKIKSSGIDWIGEIPETWNVKRLKNLLVSRNEKNNPVKTDFILSLTNDRGVIPYSKKGDVGNKSKQDISGYKLAYPNDIVMNSMNIIIGSVGLSNYFGAVSPVYYMLRPRNTSDLVEYFNYVFQSKAFQQSLIGYGNGIMELRMRIQLEKLNSVTLPHPPIDVQQKIVDALNNIIPQIDLILQNTKQSIEEYKKYKQAIITESVIKGLNPNIELKDSAIEYLGKIPSHWEVRKIKYILKPLQRPVMTTDEVITCFRDGEVTLRKKRREDGFTFSDTEKGYQGVEVGDLVFHGMDAFAGAIGISDSRGKCTPVVHVCDSRENKKYYMYMLRALAFNDVYMALSDGVRIRSSDYRNWSKLSKISVVLPPIIEQNEIANFLDEKCIQIDNLIEQKQLLLKELESYKKSLIHEYVTGKKEVL